jgi:5'-nucleotidase
MPIAALIAFALFQAAEPPRCVTIVGTNDLHGHIAEVPGGQPGLAWLAGYLRLVRKAEGPVLLLDGGDLFQGTLESNLNHGKSVIAAYNAMGYDAAVLGNHEFDYGPEQPGEDVLSAIRDRVAEAHFPFVAVNVRNHKSGTAPGWMNLFPSKLFDLDGLKVGVIGVANPDTPNLTQRHYVEGLDFLAAAGPVTEEATALRRAGAKLVVILAHEGSVCDLAVEDEAAACPPWGQLLELLHALPPGTVDAAVGGHTHQFIAHWIAGVATIESGAEGRFFGHMRVCARPQGGIDRAATHILPPVRFTAHGEYRGEAVTKDAAVAAVVQPYVDQVRELNERPLGPVLKAPLTRDNRKRSPLGSLVADALRAGAGTRVALMNAGGLRSDLPAGALTYGALYQTLPFENYAVVVTLSGAQLLRLLSAIGQVGHGYPQTSGLKLVGTTGDFRSATLDDGTPLAPDAIYELATVDFIANGGDGTGGVMREVGPEHVRQVEGKPLLRDVVLQYLKSH